MLADEAYERTSRARPSLPVIPIRNIAPVPKSNPVAHTIMSSSRWPAVVSSPGWIVATTPTRKVVPTGCPRSSQVGARPPRTVSNSSCSLASTSGCWERRYQVQVRESAVVSNAARRKMSASSRISGSGPPDAPNTRVAVPEDRRAKKIALQPKAQPLIEKIEKVAATPARVLITGENGTGKELVARAIHAGSPRAKATFVEVNCAAIPSELIESELFGHIKGSFTGAVADRAGKFEQANGGTLFLDEIGDMSSAAQAKVLRVLQDGVVTRIGGNKPVQVDVRVLAATNKNLEEEIANGRFREDLFYRLNVVPMHVPPLRERREDIPLLIGHFLHVLTEREGMPPRAIAPEAVTQLQSLDWPGNVRELRNTIERLLILATGNRISVEDVDRLVGRRDADQPGLGSLLDCKTFEDFKQAAERAFLLAKLRELDWNVSETARVLDMPRSNLYKKIERYGLSREEG